MRFSIRVSVVRILYHAACEEPRFLKPFSHLEIAFVQFQSSLFKLHITHVSDLDQIRCRLPNKTFYLILISVKNTLFEAIFKIFGRAVFEVVEVLSWRLEPLKGQGIMYICVMV